MSKQALNKKQVSLLKKLDLPIDFSSLDYDELEHIDDVVSNELQVNGINSAGDGLNEHGELCRGILDYLADF